MTQYHPVAAKIVNLLIENNYWFETFEHEPVRTSEEAALVRHGYALEQGAKAIIMKVDYGDESKFMMLVFPAHLRFDNGKVKAVLKSRSVRFATPDEIAEITDGVEPGGVPPFGNLFDLEVIVDPQLLELDTIVFNAGDRRFSVAMKSADYRQLVQPSVVAIT
jgi:prolyl-tRNA editing enzyme YbaK/EbsC (Cys-tRNA(Pro) deacylase)